LDDSRLVERDALDDSRLVVRDALDGDSGLLKNRPVNFEDKIDGESKEDSSKEDEQYASTEKPIVPGFAIGKVQSTVETRNDENQVSFLFFVFFFHSKKKKNFF
jgi:hypothetical protein